MAEFTVDSQIYLRPFKDKDAADYLQLVKDNRSHLRSWLPWVDKMRELRDVLRFFEHRAKLARRGTSYTFGIWYEGRLAGAISFNHVYRLTRRTVIGYWLAAPFQGRGIMTRAVQTLTDYAFRDIRLRRVDICVAPNNRPSRSIPERLGFEKYKYVRNAEWLYDHYVDHVVYTMRSRFWLPAILGAGMEHTKTPQF